MRVSGVGNGGGDGAIVDVVAARLVKETGGCLLNVDIADLAAYTTAVSSDKLFCSPYTHFYARNSTTGHNSSGGGGGGGDWMPGDVHPLFAGGLPFEGDSGSAECGLAGGSIADPLAGVLAEISSGNESTSGGGGDDSGTDAADPSAAPAPRSGGRRRKPPLQKMLANLAGGINSGGGGGGGGGGSSFPPTPEGLEFENNMLISSLASSPFVGADQPGHPAVAAESEFNRQAARKFLEDCFAAVRAGADEEGGGGGGGDGGGGAGSGIIVIRGSDHHHLGPNAANVGCRYVSMRLHTRHL